MTARINKGFTLVELLIVIALLGVLAAAVLAAINPLEQANRARDTRMRSDASQFLAATDRYFVAQSEFPWQTVDPVNYDSSDDAVVFTANGAQTALFGICSSGAGGCTADGVLITNNELKTEFRNRDFVTGTGFADYMYVAKEAGASSSVYACFIPLSKSERAKATRSIAVGSSTITTGVLDCATRTYAGLATSCVACLPQ